MTTDWQVLNGLKTLIVSNIANYFSEQTECPSGLLSAITSENVVIDEFDVDNMPCKVMFYISPNSGQNESQTTGSDSYTLSADIYIVCKGKTRAELVTQVHGYKACLEHLIGDNPTLGSLVDYATVTYSKFFPGVENLGIAKAYQISLEIQWQKTF